MDWRTLLHRIHWVAPVWPGLPTRWEIEGSRLNLKSQPQSNQCNKVQFTYNSGSTTRKSVQHDKEQVTGSEVQVIGHRSKQVGATELSTDHTDQRMGDLGLHQCWEATDGLQVSRWVGQPGERSKREED